jgi:hypothetical protein
MHKKHAKDGLVAITLSMDMANKLPNAEKNALKILQKQNVILTNLMINEDKKVLEEKLQYIGGLPMVYVFNRQGKWKLFEGEVNYDEIEKTVERFLKPN